MAQRHELGGALGALDRGDAGDAEHVALLRAAAGRSAPASPAASGSTPLARATRCVSALAATSTMWAWPPASKWLSGCGSAAGMAITKGKCFRCIIRGESRPPRAGALAATPPFHDSPVPVHRCADAEAALVAPRRRGAARLRADRWPARARGRRRAPRASCRRSATPTRPTSASAPRRKLGDEIMREIRVDPDYVDDPLLLEYLRDRLAAARRRVALARQHHRRHRPALRLGAVPGPRSERQRVRAAGRLRRRAPRPDRDHGDARRARLGARATRCRTSRSATSRAASRAIRSAVAGRPGGAGARPARGRRAASSPDAMNAVDRRHPGRRRSRASSTSRATSSARPTASASR